MGNLFSMARRRRSFTLVEVMVVAVMVSILTLVAVPLYSQDIVAAIMSEGVAGAGVIRADMRIYLSEHGSYAGATFAPASNNLCIGTSDLEGKYFAQSDYSLTGVSGSTYMITVAKPSKTNRMDLLTYSVDQDGSEHGAFYTGM